MKLESVKTIPVELSGRPIDHPTPGYRLWKGAVQASEPIVALVLMKTEEHVSWTRSTHRTEEILDINILYSPFAVGNPGVSVTFGIADAITRTATVLSPSSWYPTPIIEKYITGKLIDIGTIHGDPDCDLKAFFLTRTDVKSVRNGVWHVRENNLTGVHEPWKTMLSYGRTGKFSTKEMQL